MLINRKRLMDWLSILYPFMGAGKNNTATNVLNYYYDAEITHPSFWGVTNGSMSAFVLRFPTHDEPLPQRSFKVDGNLFFQTIKGIKAEEIDLLFFDTFLRVSAVDEKDNKTEVDFAYVTTKNATDYLMSTNYVSMIPNENCDTKHSALSPECFMGALQACLPYISTNDGKLSYVYFYDNKAVSANNNANSEIAIYNVISALRPFPFPAMFISKKDGELIAKSKVDFKCFINCDEQYYRLNGWSDKYNCELVVLTNALSNKERYPVIIDKDRYTEQELNASAYYTVDALLKQFNAEQITFNKDEVKELLDSVIVNGFDPVYSMLTITGNTIKYEVKYLNLKKSKTIKTKESYPEMSIKLNPNVLKNIMDIGADSISIDRKKIVAKTSNFDYICFLAD